MKSFLVFLMGLIAAIILLNPGAGIIDLIPDNFPVIGNLDEAGAMALLLMCLRYFGLDITNLFKREEKPETIVEVNPRRE